jgi:hypothetical protein
MRIIMTERGGRGYSVAVATGMSSWSRSRRQDAGHGLKRFAARQARCLGDDFTGARSESPEIDGRDLAALLEECGDDALGVRVGPPLVPVLFRFF